VALAEARADGSTVGVLFCDLDNFKLVNDGLGHEVGDELLRRIAHHLEDSVRAEDVVGRLGGDEFLVVARAVGGDTALLQLAERLAAAVTDDLRSTPFPVSVSIGAATAPAGRSNAGALIRDADAAMYRAKTSGKARAEVFRHEMRDRAERRLEVGRMLRSALDEGWFLVHYQPVFARHGDVWRLRALEALARCPLPMGGYLSPDEFIPVAEQTGMIARLGRRVAELVCDDLTRWDAALPSDSFQVWINTSVQELDGGELSAGMAERLGRAGIEPRRLGMEVTESALATGHPVALAELARLRATGMSVIIDDFGAGYSSLRSLKTYPADVVKIDRSFVADLVDEPADLAIVRSVVEIGRVTGIEIVAEGVETQDQLRTLSALGCPVVQGYLLARPVPAAVVDEHLGSWLRGEVSELQVP
jgi:diguanylate cyclase (GGDEF)-like protein